MVLQNDRRPGDVVSDEAEARMLAIRSLGFGPAACAAARCAAARPSGCPTLCPAGRLSALRMTKRHTVATAQANPEEVWGWIVEMFAVNGDTNYGGCSSTVVKSVSSAYPN